MKIFARNILLITFYLIISSLFGCNNPEKNTNNLKKEDNNGNLEYIDDFFDFGTITQGEIVSHTFRFKNSGTENLVIKNIIPDCGCTKSKIDKEIFAPNEEGKIEIIFDSKGWQGMQYKSVALRTNSPIREKSVTFKANVVVKE